MATITTSGPSNWRELFEGHPGLAVTPENHDRLLAEAAAAEPEPAPQPEAPAGPGPEPVAVRMPPRRMLPPEA